MDNPIEILKEYLKKEDYYNAIQETKVLLKKSPNNIPLLNFLGVAQNLNKQFKDSISTFKKTLKLDPSQTKILINLASAYKKDNQFKNAIKIYSGLFTGEIKTIKHGIALMNCYYDNRNIDLCIITCKKILEKDKNNMETLIKLANCLWLSRDYKEGLKYLNYAKEIEPKNTNILILMAAIYSELESYKKSEDLYKLILKDNDSENFYFIFNNLGILYKNQGKIKKAKKYFKYGLNIRPDDEYLNRSLGVLLLDNNEQREAIQYLVKGGENCKSILLWVYYNLDLNFEYDDLLDSIASSNPFSMRVASVTDFVSEQNDIDNKYPLCPDNINLMRHMNINKELNEQKFSFEKLINECRSKKMMWEPKESNTFVGYQTFGNLFEIDSPNINILRKTIEQKILDYKNQITTKEEILFTKYWPNEMNFKAWLVELKSDGWQGSHIHSQGWLSGVFYITIPPDLKLNEGSIEFTKYGEKETSKFKKNSTARKIIRPEQGDLVLFPSSLFHKTHPFKSKSNRLCIGFDLLPREEIKTKNKII